MRCEELDELIEDVADGLPLDGERAAHMGSCATCQSRVALARGVDRVLETREVPEPSPRFTAAVMAHVRRDRWRAEQLVDAGFNIAMTAGVALIAAGMVGVAWTFGWFSIEPTIVDLAVVVLERWLGSAADQLRMVAIAALLLTSALGLWWWVEGEGSDMTRMG